VTPGYAENRKSRMRNEARAGAKLRFLPRNQSAAAAFCLSLRLMHRPAEIRAAGRKTQIPFVPPPHRQIDNRWNTCKVSDPHPPPPIQLAPRAVLHSERKHLFGSSKHAPLDTKHQYFSHHSSILLFMEIFCPLCNNFSLFFRAKNIYGIF